MLRFTFMICACFICLIPTARADVLEFTRSGETITYFAKDFRTVKARVHIPKISHKKKTHYSAYIDSASKKYDITKELVEAVIQVESAFNQNATSPKGAMGLMQLMPATARDLGVKDAYNPQQNIEGGVKYLRYLLDVYEGETRLALAAYNAGEGAVNKYRGIPPYKETCLLYTSPSPRDLSTSRMPSSA